MWKIHFFLFTGGVEVDFSHTVNMLTLLAKADIKLKASATKEHGHDSRLVIIKIVYNMLYQRQQIKNKHFKIVS